MTDKKQNKPSRGTVAERIAHARRSQWIKFGIVALLYLLFVIWDNNYWLLLGLLLIFDIYISKVVNWGAWKQSNNKTLRTIADWADAIVFALIAVYFINIFIFQNYKIPSSSLEKTLLVGDYLFVSKVAYGPRVPNTPLAFPLTHHTLPIFNTKSYRDWPHWEYKRLKGLRNVERDDIVVFNFPAGDTVALNAQNADYHALVEAYGWQEVNTNKRKYGNIVYRPVDRRENYVKRCVGLPGENLHIINNKVYINGEELPFPKRAQLNYFVETAGGNFTEKQFRELEISKEDRRIAKAPGYSNPVYLLPLTQEAHDKIIERKWGTIIQVERENPEYAMYYPYGNSYGWTRDNYGPVWIPKKGETIVLDKKNIEMYSRCIVNYEGNSLRTNGDKVYLNGNPANSYTFKYDYYFMMGDNRHNSADSRSWGFVPEDHVVGQPILIWMSADPDRGLFDGGIRWNRIFRFVKNQ
jgi:signal peptidase I, bacterial type